MPNRDAQYQTLSAELGSARLFVSACFFSSLSNGRADPACADRDERDFTGVLEILPGTLRGALDPLVLISTSNLLTSETSNMSFLRTASLSASVISGVYVFISGNMVTTELGSQAYSTRKTLSKQMKCMW